MSIRVGILSLQGAFREHIEILAKCGADTVEVKFPGQLDEIDGLVIPGGESTTIRRLLKKYKFKSRLDKFHREGKPIFVTCAGLILIAKNIEGEGRGLGYIDADIERNAYGRQIDSFEELLDLHLNGNRNGKKFRSVFIRAPKIKNTGKSVKVLVKMGEDAVLIRNGNVIASTFHPELTGDLRIHKYFINMIKDIKGEK